MAHLKRWTMLGSVVGSMLGALAGGTQAGTYAEQPGGDEHADLVRASLVPELAGIEPGGTLWIGVRFQIKDGWHTYWPGQNDTGFGTTIEVAAPAGYTVGEARWPAPERYRSPGGILDHVHHHEVMALIPITAPNSEAVGSSIDLSFDLAWLVCDDVCIPGWETLTLSVPVVERPSPASGSASLFASSRARIPTEPTERDGVAVTWTGSVATVGVKGAHGLVFYPAEQGSPVEDLMTSGERKGDRLELVFTDENPSLSGVLEIHADNGATRWIELRSAPGGMPSDT